MRVGGRSIDVGVEDADRFVTAVVGQRLPLHRVLGQRDGEAIADIEVGGAVRDGEAHSASGEGTADKARPHGEAKVTPLPKGYYLSK